MVLLVLHALILLVTWSDFYCFRSGCQRFRNLVCMRQVQVSAELKACTSWHLPTACWAYSWVVWQGDILSINNETTTKRVQKINNSHRAWQNQQNEACDQRRIRSACACCQADLRLCWCVHLWNSNISKSKLFLIKMHERRHVSKFSLVSHALWSSLPCACTVSMFRCCRGVIPLMWQEVIFLLLAEI